MFSVQEKERIRREMLVLARELFSRQGLKKTSLEELTRPFGIAKSSFYLFFDSKEQLYLQVLAQDAPDVTARMARARDNAPTAHAAIVNLLAAILNELETNALTRRMLTHPDELAQLAAHATPEQMAQGDRNALNMLVPFIQAKQQRGEMIQGDPVVFARVLAAITLLSLHREQIGTDQYPQVMSTLVDLVAVGLTTPGRGNVNQGE